MLKITSIVCLLACGISVGVLARESERPATQPAPPARVTFYAAVVQPGPAWKAATERGQQPDLAAHLAYMNDLRARGKVLMAGPFADGAGGLIVYRADSIEEARQLSRDDPATAAGVFEPRLHTWLVNAADVAQPPR
jgi:uncharacterized protein YciI